MVNIIENKSRIIITKLNYRYIKLYFDLIVALQYIIVNIN